MSSFLDELDQSRSIALLQKCGNKVTVRHFRYGWIKEPFGRCLAHPILVPTFAGLFFYFSNLGGGTEILIKMQGSKHNIIVTNSCCRLDENFCYKIGVLVALNKIPKGVWDQLIGVQNSEQF